MDTLIADHELTRAVMEAIRRRAQEPVTPHDLAAVPVSLVARSTVRGLTTVEARP